MLCLKKWIRKCAIKIKIIKLRQVDHTSYLKDDLKDDQDQG